VAVFSAVLAGEAAICLGDGPDGGIVVVAVFELAEAIAVAVNENCELAILVGRTSQSGEREAQKHSDN
jgi:hypothetical protein